MNQQTAKVIQITLSQLIRSQSKTHISHIYENQSELLQDYYTRPIRNDVPVEHVNEINTVINNEKQRSSTNDIYQNIQSQEKKFGQSNFS